MDITVTVETDDIIQALREDDDFGELVTETMYSPTFIDTITDKVIERIDMEQEIRDNVEPQLESLERRIQELADQLEGEQNKTQEIVYKPIDAGDKVVLVVRDTKKAELLRRYGNTIKGTEGFAVMGLHELADLLF